MGIFWITTRHPPDRGGMARSSGRIVAGLRERGHDVTVLHLSDAAASPMDQGLTVFPGRGWADDPALLFWQHRKKMEKSVIAGFGGGYAGYLAVLWARWLGARSLVLFRGNDFDASLHDTRRGWMTHFILENAHCLGAVSTEMRDRIRSLRKGAVVFTPNSIDVTEWEFLAADMKAAEDWRRENLVPLMPVVSMFGELKGKKGFDTAYALFSSFHFGARAWLLTIGTLGDDIKGDYPPPVPGFWKHVPYAEKDDLPPFYAASDVVFIPSYYDGMPNVLLEAMALRRVVAAARSGGIPDVIEHGVNGLLFDPMDLDDAARALDSALSMSGHEKARMGEEAGRLIRENFTPHREIGVIEEMILTVTAIHK